MLREVEIETRVDIAGRKKRADYIFRTDGVSKFVCEAKKVKEDLNSKYAYQAQRYAFNLSLFPATLSNFKLLQLFIVGGKPDQHFPFPVYLAWHFSEYKSKAPDLWDLFARERRFGFFGQTYCPPQKEANTRKGATGLAMDTREGADS